MSESPKYRVIKAMPGLAVGDELEIPHDGCDYYTKMGKHPDGHTYIGTVRIDIEEIARNPDYFRLIEEVKWTDSAMNAYAKWYNEAYTNNIKDRSLEAWIEWCKPPTAKKPWSAADTWEKPESLNHFPPMSSTANILTEQKGSVEK